MNLLLMLAMCALATSARADCEACVDGWCHSRRTLVEGFQVTDQLAIDRKHNVLYLQLNPNLNSVFFLNDRKFKLIQLMNTSGMAVDQDTQDLYVANYNGTFYKFNYDTNVPEVFYVNKYEKDFNLLADGSIYNVYKNRHCNYLSFIYQDNELKYYTKRVNISIIELLVGDFHNTVYYVSDRQVHVLASDLIKLVTVRFCALSTDNNGNIYLADAGMKVIYKLNDSDELTVYAAYKTGSVDKFVFDRDNNIVYHDTTDGNIVTWELGVNKCKIHEHTHYVIHEFQ